MAVWRRRARELFPELRHLLSSADKVYDNNTYQVFAELLEIYRQAVDGESWDVVDRIMGFAAWCSRQTSAILWNPAGVSFYEHAFEELTDRQLAVCVRLVPADVWANIESLMAWAYGPEKLEEMRRYRQTSVHPH